MTKAITKISRASIKRGLFSKDKFDLWGYVSLKKFYLSRGDAQKCFEDIAAIVNSNASRLKRLRNTFGEFLHEQKAVRTDLRAISNRLCEIEMVILNSNSTDTNISGQGPVPDLPSEESSSLQRYYSFIGDDSRFVIEVTVPSIEGWLHLFSAFSIPLLSHVQAEIGLSGPIFEIGVFAGKTVALLCSQLSKGERYVGIDINIKAGVGDLLTAQCPSEAEGAFLIQADSIVLDSAKVLAETGVEPRIVHVDGFHSLEQARSDLLIAFSVCSPLGIIMLDDFFSVTCPGVTEALYGLVASGENNGFYPFAIGGGKAFLSKDMVRDRYLCAMKQFLPVPFRKDDSADCYTIFKMFGKPVGVWEMN